MQNNAAIFDLDGTLLNTLEDLANAGNSALRQMGYPEHPMESFRHFVGNGARMLCFRMLPEDHRTQEDVVQARAFFDKEYQSHMFDKTVPYPGIPELLAALLGQDIQLGVVSNKPDEFVQSIVERYFPGIFSAVSGSQNALTKPDPSGVLTVLNNFGVAPKNALYIGDSSVDIETARNAGTNSCGVLWGFRDWEELHAAGAEHIVSRPEEILALFR